MSEQKKMTEGARGAGLDERASALNEIGAHYFVGWLISAGFQRPEVMAEIEWVLEDMETSPDLLHCWMKEDAVAVLAEASTGSIPQPEPEAQSVTCVSAPCLVADLPAPLPAPPNPLSSPVQFEPMPVRRSRFPGRILEVLFGRSRVAA